MKFDIYGRMVLQIEKTATGYQVLQIGSDGKRRLREDLCIPGHIGEQEIEAFLDALLHESARPGARIQRLY
jgi:hypothetical protein